MKSSLHSRYYTEARNKWRIYLRGLAPGLHSSEETWQRWRAVGDTVSNLNGPGIEPTTSSAVSDTFNRYAEIDLLCNNKPNVIFAQATLWVGKSRQPPRKRFPTRVLLIGKSVSLWSYRHRFDSESGQTNHFKIAIHSFPG